jgi:hypothetical protein
MAEPAAQSTAHHWRPTLVSLGPARNGPTVGFSGESFASKPNATEAAENSERERRERVTRGRERARRGLDPPVPHALVQLREGRGRVLVRPPTTCVHGRTVGDTRVGQRRAGGESRYGDRGGYGGLVSGAEAKVLAASIARYESAAQTNGEESQT